MYYAEMEIDGVLHCKSTPDGAWRPVTPWAMTFIIKSLRDEVNRLRAA